MVGAVQPGGRVDAHGAAGVGRDVDVARERFEVRVQLGDAHVQCLVVVNGAWSRAPPRLSALRVCGQTRIYVVCADVRFKIQQPLTKARP